MAAIAIGHADQSVVQQAGKARPSYFFCWCYQIKIEYIMCTLLLFIGRKVTRNFCPEPETAYASLLQLYCERISYIMLHMHI